MAALTAGLAPVRPRRRGAEAGALLLLCAAQLAGFAILARAVPFAASAQAGLVQTASKAGGLGLGAALLTALALASMTPGARDARLRALGVGALVLGAFLLGLDWTQVQPGMAGKPVMAGQAGTFFAPGDGLRCLAASLTLALPLALALTVIGRAAAPPRPALTGTLIGGASGLWGGLVYAVQCPYVTAPYVALWYGLAAAAGAVLGRWLLGPRLGW